VQRELDTAGRALMRPAIIEPAITQLVAETRAAIEAVRDAEGAVEVLDKKLVTAREAAKARRLELGLILRKAREKLPKRGTSTNGWRAYLEAIEMAESTAHRYMEEAGLVINRTGFQSSNLEHSEQPYDEGAPPPTDEDAPPDSDVQAPAPAPEPNRGAWCTPRKWALRVGPWDLDSFSNPYSHIIATETCQLERDDDGFGDGEAGSYFIKGVGFRRATKRTRFWGQPEYRDGFVDRVITHYGHTRFCFLLRLDTSTGWFERLWSISELIMIPRGERIEFEPPPGVEPSSNPYPHGFYYRSAEDVTEEIRNNCFEWRISK
jgi:hypothetical protein